MSPPLSPLPARVVLWLADEDELCVLRLLRVTASEQGGAAGPEVFCTQWEKGLKGLAPSVLAQEPAVSCSALLHGPANS